RAGSTRKVTERAGAAASPGEKRRWRPEGSRAAAKQIDSCRQPSTSRSPVHPQKAISRRPRRSLAPKSSSETGSRASLGVSRAKQKAPEYKARFAPFRLPEAREGAATQPQAQNPVPRTTTRQARRRL